MNDERPREGGARTGQVDSSMALTADEPGDLRVCAWGGFADHLPLPTVDSAPLPGVEPRGGVITVVAYLDRVEMTGDTSRIRPLLREWGWRPVRGKWVLDASPALGRYEACRRVWATTLREHGCRVQFIDAVHPELTVAERHAEQRRWHQSQAAVVATDAADVVEQPRSALSAPTAGAVYKVSWHSPARAERASRLFRQRARAEQFAAWLDDQGYGAVVERSAGPVAFGPQAGGSR